MGPDLLGYGPCFFPACNGLIGTGFVWIPKSGANATHPCKLITLHCNRAFFLEAWSLSLYSIGSCSICKFAVVRVLLPCPQQAVRKSAVNANPDMSDSQCGHTGLH